MTPLEVTNIPVFGPRFKSFTFRQGQGNVRRISLVLFNPHRAKRESGVVDGLPQPCDKRFYIHMTPLFPLANRVNVRISLLPEGALSNLLISRLSSIKKFHFFWTIIAQAPAVMMQAFDIMIVQFDAIHLLT